MTTDQQKALNYIAQVSRGDYSWPEPIHLPNVKKSTLFLLYKALHESMARFDSVLKTIVEELATRDSD